MKIAEGARALGRRGGIARARRLPAQRRAEIALSGARARAESLRLAAAIRQNFDCLAAVHQLHPPAPVRPESTCRRKLPSVDGPETQD